MKRQTVLTSVAITAIGMIVFWLSQRDWMTESDWWQRAEGILIDRRYRNRGPRPADTNIVLIGLETKSMTLDRLRPESIEQSKTLQMMREPFPWNRGVFAATLEKLVNAGAKVVLFDFFFPNPKPGDEALADAIAKHQSKVIIGSMIEMNEHVYLEPTEELLPKSGPPVHGLVNVWPDADRTVRRGRYRTSQAREDYRLYQFAGTRYPDNLIQVTALAVQKFVGGVTTPPYDRNNFIDFQGPRGTYEPIAIERLFVDADWETPPINGGILFSNKIVIVGPLAEIFKDVHNTPWGEMPGPEVQAQMIATLLNGSSLEEPAAIYNTALAFGMMVLAVVICLFVTHAALKPILLLGTIGGFWVACDFVFTHAGVVVPMTPPLFAFTLTGSLGIALQFFQEQIERRRTRNLLVRFVSRNVANFVLDNPEAFKKAMLGEKKSVTILFSDIRGFTTMTEERDSRELVTQLNEYFDEMVSHVDAVEGTLQKFIGDAVMAAWGDTKEFEPKEAARRAVVTALKMREGLASLNEKWKSRSDRNQLTIGIGVNCGEAVVGLVGGKGRDEITAMGDVVNLAARLETATKQFYTDVLVGESVEALTREHFVFRKVGLLTVKGKLKPVEAFAVLSDHTKPAPEWLKLYHEGVELFRHREFANAIEIFKIVRVQTGGQDFLCEMYIEWSTRYHRSPPPINWAGNFVLKEK